MPFYRNKLETRSKTRQLSTMDRLHSRLICGNRPSFVFLLFITSLCLCPVESQSPASNNVTHVVTLVRANEDLKKDFHKDVQFPTPQVENVYKAWKPVDFGNPTRDVTMYYAPPSLERVHFDGKGSSSAESRSFADDFGEKKKSREELFPVVIAAEPSSDPKEQAYSVYGSPNIDYSKLYSQPPVKLATHSEPLDDGRDAPFLAFQRDYINSASGPKSADPIDYSPALNSHPRREDHIGGIRYIEPPNRQPQQSYFYYSDDSPYYKERLAEKKTSTAAALIEEATKPPAHSLPKPPPTTRKQVPEISEGKSFGSKPVPIQAAQSEPGHVNAVVYSFENQYGQKSKVGVILDEEDLTPDASTLTHSSPPQTGSRLIGRPRAEQVDAADPVKIIPLTSNHLSESQGPHQSNSGGSVIFGNQDTAYPLGAPYRLPERPKFFPVQNHPPIYKTRPNHLEGVFGPALPQKPNPDTIEFPEEHEYGKPKPKNLPLKTNRRYDIDDHDERDYSYVYKTDREMEYRRPAVILRVGNSNELYRPDDPLDKIWKPDFTDVLEEEDGEGNIDLTNTQTEKPFRYEQTEKPFRFEQTEKPTKTQDEEEVASRPKRIPENTRRSLVIFPDDKKTQLVRPFREVSQQPAEKNKNAAQSESKLKSQSNQEPEPNYKVVIGASYDDNSAAKSQDFDFDESLPEEESKIESREYTKEELYDLCIKEVPDYLRKDICGSLKTTEAKEETKNQEVVPPKDAHLIRAHRPVDNEALGVTINVVTEKSTSQKAFLVPASTAATDKPDTTEPVTINSASFLGIPLELPKEVKRPSAQDHGNQNNFKVYGTIDRNINSSSSEDVEPNNVDTTDSETDSNLEDTTQYENQPFQPSEILTNSFGQTKPRPPAPRPPPARPEARNPGGYFSKLMNFFGGGRQAPAFQPSQPQRLLQRRVKVE